MNNPTQPSAGNAEPAVVKYRGPKEVLIAARKLIERRENWCQGQYRVGCKMCADGALMSVDKALSLNYWRAFRMLEKQIYGCRSVHEFNDTHTHAEVLAAFDRAIAQCAVGDQSCNPASTEVA